MTPESVKSALALISTIVIGACALIYVWRQDFEHAAFFIAALTHSPAQLLVGKTAS